MTFTALQTILNILFLSLVAGTPIVMAVFCCSAFERKVARLLPWAAAPAFLTVVAVPVDTIVEVDWFFMGSRMGIDGTGRIFLCISAFIWFLASFSCRSLIENDENRSRFLLLFLTAMAGNFGLILAQGMLGFYLFFALMSFAVYGLVIHKGTDDAKKAGRIYLTLALIGEVALFTALIILAHNTGSLSMEDISGGSYQPLILALLFIGFGVKIGALPFHGWMMPAYQATPIPAAAVLAGSMVNAGILGWMRFLPLGKISCPQEAWMIITAGSLAAVFGVIIGLNSKQGGAVLGSSSISQMGLITVIFGLGLLNQDAGLLAVPVLILYAVHHSLAKSCLFFGYDLVANQRNKLSHLQLAVLLFPGLALAGLPFTSGAVSKTAFKELAITIGEPWYSLCTFFLPITTVGTTILMLHFLEVLKRTKGVSKSSNTKQYVLTAGFIATATTLWLWPPAWKYAKHALTGTTSLEALFPIAGGYLLFLAWRRFFSYEKITDDEQEKQSRFDFLVSGIMKFLDNTDRLHIQTGGLISYLSRLTPQLRKSEKIMGRWRIAGLSYLVLCFCLLYLLL